MKLRHKKKKFWWTWHLQRYNHGWKNHGWGMARIKHQGKSK